MENPWKNLEKANDEYIAVCDKEHITPALRRDFAFDTLPWPYMGDPNKAVVYVLAKSAMYEHTRGLGTVADKEKAIMHNLKQSHDSRLPLIPLDERFDETDFQRWWIKKLGGIAGFDAVAEFVFVAQYYSYSHHSRIGRHEILPSQHYTHGLVEKAMKAGKIIVPMYAKKEWYKAIPRLRNYEKCYTLTPTGADINRSTIGSDNFEKIVKAIKSAKNCD